jgi:hypothetical protein
MGLPSQQHGKQSTEKGPMDPRSRSQGLPLATAPQLLAAVRRLSEGAISGNVGGKTRRERVKLVTHAWSFVSRGFPFPPTDAAHLLFIFFRRLQEWALPALQHQVNTATNRACCFSIRPLSSEWLLPSSCSSLLSSLIICPSRFNTAPKLTYPETRMSFLPPLLLVLLSSWFAPPDQTCPCVNTAPNRQYDEPHSNPYLELRTFSLERPLSFNWLLLDSLPRFSRLTNALSNSIASEEKRKKKNPSNSETHL